MTVGEMWRRLTAQLEEAGCDSPAFDARLLLEDIGKVGRGRVDSRSTTLLLPEQVQAVQTAADKRADGYPLQYILGEWDFLTLTLKVGEGVLIPRPDTELLCETAAAFLQEKGYPSPRVLDLCAGSGCVGLGVASLYPTAKVTAVELSDDAFSYLQDNCRRYPSYTVQTVQADVLSDTDRFEGEYDLILSNPPYIPARDMSELMREVQYEPEMALNGGDGLVFYRALAEIWSRKLADSGSMMVEIGIGQADDVMALFRDAGFKTVYSLPDLAGIERVIVGKM